jgi:hypothetical protein
MSSLSDGLTDKQGAIIPYLLRLLRAIPGASLETLRLLMDEKIKGASASQFWPGMQTLSDVDQGFVKNNFYNASMNATKKSISWKIYGAMGSDTFRKMFSAPTNSFDARAAMRDRKVVLARGSENTLGEHGLPTFMQYVVSQCFLAALARFHIPKEERHQCYLLCDEASHIFNHQTARILTECRKLGLSFISATQLIEQIPREVKAAIYGATSFKFAGEVSHTDANIMANEMRCKGEFIQHMETYPPKYAEWAAYVSGTTERAVKITAPMMVLEALPKLSHFEKVRKMVVQDTEQTAGSKRESDELPVREVDVPPPQPIEGSSILERKPSIAASSSAPAPQPDGSPPQFEIKRGKDNWIPQPPTKDQSNTKESVRTSDEIAAARAALAFQVVRIVEDGLTPFINESLQKFHGVEDYVDLENNRRAELKAKGVPIRLLRPDALSTRWDYSMILNTIVGSWSCFKKVFEDRRVPHAQQVRADIYQLISLRDRGIGHASLGSFSDEDLQDLCKMAARVLRATGASRDAERVNSLRQRHSWCS